MTLTASDRRRAPRVPVSMKVEAPFPERTLGFGYAQNVSESGLAIEAQALDKTAAPVKVGEEVRLRFKLPQSSLVITAMGRVIRIDLSGAYPRYALTFIRLDPDFRSEVVRYVHQTIK